jgi:hypothetical protein
MQSDTKMKMPGPKVHGEIAVRRANLWRLDKPNLKNCAFNARADDDPGPILYEKVLDQIREDGFRWGEIAVRGQRVIEFVLDLVEFRNGDRFDRH